MPWVCVVEEGKTTRYDLDLSGGIVCTLKGKLTLDEKVPKAWSARIFEDKNMQALESSGTPTSLDAEGGFVINSREPGLYILFVFGSPGEGPDLRFRDRVKLVKGENAWKLDVTLGKVSVKGARKLSEPGSMILYRWKGRGDLVSFTQIDTESSGDIHVLTVPVGMGSILRARPDAYMTEGYAMQEILQVEVQAGETVEVEL